MEMSMKISIKQYEEDLHNFNLQIRLAQTAKAKQLVADGFSTKYKPCLKLLDDNIFIIFNTIMHYIFKNFNDKNAFLEKNRRPKELQYATSLQQRNDILNGKVFIEENILDELLISAFAVYTNSQIVHDCFEICLEDYVNNDHKMMIGLRMGLNILVANVVRGYTANSGDFSIVKRFIDHQKHLKVDYMKNAVDLLSIETILMAFIEETRYTNGGLYLFELYDQINSQLNLNRT